MATGYIEFPNTEKFITSLPKILSNDKAALTWNAGTAFPTTGLSAGMPCFRTDQQKLYVYDGKAWQLLLDLKDMPIQKSVQPTLATKTELANQKTELTNSLNTQKTEITTALNTQKTELTKAINAKAPSSHTHTTAQVTGLDTALEDKQPKGDYALNNQVVKIVPQTLSEEQKAQARDNIGVSPGLPLGHHYAWPFGTVPANSIQCNGGTYNRELYADFWKWLNDNGLVKTEAQWQEIATANGGYCSWYSSGDGSKTFRTPKFAPFMQLAIATGTVGNYHQSGAPNITGHISPHVTVFTDKSTSGAFYTLGDANISDGLYHSGADKGVHGYMLDASRSNAIYGRSATIQPESHEWMICVVVLGKVTNIGEADVANVMQAVSQTRAELANYMPVVGGTMTGNLRFPVGVLETKNSASNVELNFWADSTAAAGAAISLRNNNDPNSPGSIALITRKQDGSFGSVLHAMNNGSLIWNRRSVVTSINGVGAGLDGNVTFEFANNTWYKCGDDVLVGDNDTAGCFCVRGANGDSGVGFRSTNDAHIRTIRLANDANFYVDTGLHAHWLKATSDIRLKEDLEPLNDNILNNLKAYRYTLKTDNEKHVGLIAQDVIKVLPEAVTEGREGFYALDYNAIVAVLVDKVNSLEKRIKELEGK